MTITRHFLLAAGGTGGHMMPAYALARELIGRGHRAALITDARGAKIGGAPEGLAVHILPAGRLGGGPVGWARAARAIWQGRRAAMALIREFEPAAAVGFGGYPALPALLAAQARRVPTAIHEQNAVLGRVNRLLASRSGIIATAYPKVQRVPESARERVALVGNPVREEVLALRTRGYPPYSQDGVLRILVTGGSQGASVFADVVPQALSLMPTSLRQRLQVTQQARAEDIDRVRAAYRDHAIPAEVATYLDDMPAKLDWAHIVIGRAGASTVAELAVAGRPSILVPLPSATDDHQTYNVDELVAAGGAWCIAQPQFTVAELAKRIQRLALDPAGLEAAATAALSCGRPDATRDLADLIERCGGAGNMQAIHRFDASAEPHAAVATTGALAS